MRKCLHAERLKLRACRIAAGGFMLASAEVKFKIDTETHDRMDVGIYQVRSPKKSENPKLHTFLNA